MTTRGWPVAPPRPCALCGTEVPAATLHRGRIGGGKRGWLCGACYSHGAGLGDEPTYKCGQCSGRFPRSGPYRVGMVEGHERRICPVCHERRAAAAELEAFEIQPVVKHARLRPDLAGNREGLKALDAYADEETGGTWYVLR